VRTELYALMFFNPECLVTSNQVTSDLCDLLETPGEKPECSRVAWVVGATLEPSGFSSGVSQKELRELEKVGRIRDET
jgi:hypothetical protein